MARHDQRPEPRDMTCRNCKDGNCEICVDTLRKKFTDDMVCECRRKQHSEKVKAA